MQASRVYERSLFRAMSIMWAPLLFAIFVFSGLKLSPRSLSSMEFIFVLVMVGIYTVPHLVLLINHWKHSEGTSVSILGKDIEIINPGKKITLPIKYIDKIEEFRVSYRYEFLHYWKINAGGDVFIVSNLVMPKSAFDRYFWNKIEEKIVRWPRMNNDHLKLGQT
jgi:hypothetical protein